MRCILINCPNCTSDNSHPFFTVENAPVHSVLLLDSREEALNYPQRRIALHACDDCGFIFNAEFDTAVHEYAGRYEPTQGYSPTFNRFHQRLVADLIERFDLRGKRVVEIGCGQGEFLALLVEMGGNVGVGFDPAYSAERGAPAHDTLKFIQDFYSPKYADTPSDFIACKMTLEHIPNTAEFIHNIRTAIGSRDDVVVFFQVPDMVRVLEETAFWDIYYEHCSYFSLGSLAHLFRQARFDIVDLWKDYGDQYLMIAVRPTLEVTEPVLPQEQDLSTLCTLRGRFSTDIHRVIHNWGEQFKQWGEQNKRIVLWGGGSKAVAFLTKLGLRDEISLVVDINPHKANTYIAGTGQKIVNPEALVAQPPDVVLVMNPIYVDEIGRTLANLDLYPQVIPITAITA